MIRSLIWKLPIKWIAAQCHRGHVCRLRPTNYSCLHVPKNEARPGWGLVLRNSRNSLSPTANLKFNKAAQKYLQSSEWQCALFLTRACDSRISESVRLGVVPQDQICSA
jgi:hypothetical protein